jgi:hypothetical protein
LHSAKKAAGVPIDGSIIQDARAYAQWTKDNVPKQRLTKCDNCDGESDGELPCCPFCGVVGKATMDEQMPDFGWLRGKRIELADVPALPEWDRVEVEVDAPGVGRIRPWRFMDDGSGVRFVGEKKGRRR